MTSCYELENDENEKEAKLEKPPKNDGEALISLETLPICGEWRKIFSLPKEICQQIVTALQHPKLYVDKVESAGQLVKDVAHYAACNTAITLLMMTCCWAPSLTTTPCSSLDTSGSKKSDLSLIHI